MTTQPKTYLEQAIKDGHAKISGEGEGQRIHYNAADHHYAEVLRQRIAAADRGEFASDEEVEAFFAERGE